MIETILQSDLYAILAAVAPSVTAILGVVATVLLSLKKLTSMITDFKQSAELKQLIAEMQEQRKENKQLKKMNEKLISELTRIAPSAKWSDTDDGEN